MKKEKVLLWTAVGFFGAFIALLLSVLFIDVQAVGPQSSKIGWATVNKGIHDFLGVNETWDKITDALAAVAILSAAAMAGLGVYQLIERKDIKKVDGDLLWLCGFSVAVIFFYVLFEVIAVNYRPILTGDGLEPSFPSTHTMFSVFVMGGAAYQCLKRIPLKGWNWVGFALCALVAALTSAGRLLAGVHWLTDVLGGVLFSGGALSLYLYLVKKTRKTQLDAEE